ncbi:hypothetical protein HFD88_001701 [Aspergillus terreus]|nr:hypothetical protein HFD88_001701 [Aspergillus terreus]
MKNSWLLYLAASASAAVTEDFTALTHFWDYERSHPVYPSPKGVGTSEDWADAYRVAASMVAKMTNEEKASITTGATHPQNGCAGWAPPVKRVGFPGMCMQGSGAGLRPTELVTAYAAPISIAASWNDDLAFHTGFHRGLEYEAKGVNVALEPICGPIGRIATNGRNWEGYGSDPYLTGKMNYQTIRGIQKRGTVSACVKHFIAYEQETNRLPIGHNESVSSNLDDQTMHELYLWPFMDAMKAESGSVMCAYNRINNSYACQNSKAMNGLLKTELGFQGFVMSDWEALHAGYEAADAGLDMVMPDSGGFWGTNLSLAVTNGSFAQERLDDMATRIVAVWSKFGSLPNPGHGDPPTSDWTLPHNHTNAMSHASQGPVYQGALEGHVLVKNVNNALPLKKPTVLSLFGYDAVAPAVVDPVSSTKWRLGYESIDFSEDMALRYFSGYWSNGTNIWPNGPRAGYEGTLITGGGSSTSNPPWIVSPYAAFAQQAREDLTMLSWNFKDQDPGVIGGSDACIVFINEFASEGFDRGGLADPWSDELVRNVANKCDNTMVVIHNAGIRVVDAWIDHPNITAVILAHLPGQEAGNILVDLMYGKSSPSGRLPYTIPKKESDFGPLLDPTYADSGSQYHTQANFTEGVYIDYKHFIKNNITPRYAFGYGLTYSNFTYSNMEIALRDDIVPSFVDAYQGTLNTANSTDNATRNGNNTERLPWGGAAPLWENIATVTMEVANTGQVAAAEVAQLYVGIPGAPEKQLRGYKKKMLDVGQRVQLQFALTRRDLSVWNSAKQGWDLQRGTYKIYVGKSVLDIPLEGRLEVR